MLNKKSPNPIDVHVGSRVRLRRMMLGMSQEKLGDALGITFQQIQKYEKGTNRIGASRLQHIARVLTIPVSFFFEDAPGSEGAASPSPMTEFAGLDETTMKIAREAGPKPRRGGRRGDVGNPPKKWPFKPGETAIKVKPERVALYLNSCRAHSAARTIHDRVNREARQLRRRSK